MPYLTAGEMAEWSIALPWKGSNWATGSGVRTPEPVAQLLPFQGSAIDHSAISPAVR